MSKEIETHINFSLQNAHTNTSRNTNIYIQSKIIISKGCQVIKWQPEQKRCANLPLLQSIVMLVKLVTVSRACKCLFLHSPTGRLLEWGEKVPMDKVQIFPLSQTENIGHFGKRMGFSQNILRLRNKKPHLHTCLKSATERFHSTWGTSSTWATSSISVLLCSSTSSSNPSLLVTEAGEEILLCISSGLF